MHKTTTILRHKNVLKMFHTKVVLLKIDELFFLMLHTFFSLVSAQISVTHSQSETIGMLKGLFGEIILLPLKLYLLNYFSQKY